MSAELTNQNSERLHPTPPLGVIDRDGNVWPWDGRNVNEHILSAGSRYIYTKSELKRHLAAIPAPGKQRRANPDEPPAAPTPHGGADEVLDALGMEGPPGRRAERAARASTKSEAAKAVLD